MAEITKKESKLKDKKLPFRTLKSFDEQVTTNLRTSKIETRYYLPRAKNPVLLLSKLVSITLTT